MEIILIRYCYSRWGVMGALYIDGLCICHTCEHPDRHLSVGKYDVNLKGEKLFINSLVKCGKKAKCPAIRDGNGPFHSTDGSIIVGKYRASGLVINSEQTYNVLLKRADRCNKNDKSITLTIKDRKKNVYEIL